MKHNQLLSYLGKNVKVTLNDGYTIIGILETTYGTTSYKIPHASLNNFTVYRIIDGYKQTNGVFKSSHVKMIEPLEKENEKMDIVIIQCPKCGSKKIAVEKRLFGNAECLDCKYYGKYAEFQEKLSKVGKKE